MTNSPTTLLSGVDPELTERLVANRREFFRGAALKLGLRDAQLRLGTAYLAAGQKADAVKAFTAVKGNAADEMVAKLYATYARSDESAAAAAPAASDDRAGRRGNRRR